MKHNLKRKTWFCAATLLGASVLMTPVSSVYAEDVVVVEDANVDSPDAETWSSKREWVYKVIDGHLYKRLYNYTTNSFESDWILVQ